MKVSPRGRFAGGGGSGLKTGMVSHESDPPSELPVDIKLRKEKCKQTNRKMMPSGSHVHE